jgi:hypothetical protein
MSICLVRAQPDAAICSSAYKSACAAGGRREPSRLEFFSWWFLRLLRDCMHVKAASPWTFSQNAPANLSQGLGQICLTLAWELTGPWVTKSARNLGRESRVFQAIQSVALTLEIVQA